MSASSSDLHEAASPLPDALAGAEVLAAALQAQNAELLAIIAAQAARIGDLERQLGLNRCASRSATILYGKDPHFGLILA